MAQNPNTEQAAPARRPQHGEAHTKAQLAWQKAQDHTEAVRINNRMVRATRTPQHQLLVLETRPGRSFKERARMNKLVAA